MTTIRRALLFSFLEQYSSTVVGIVSTMIISRLVTPRDTGIYSVAAAVSLLLSNIRDFGISSYLMQEKDLTQERFSSAFGASIVVASMVFVALFCFSYPLAYFYNEDGVRQVMQVTMLSVLAIPFSSIVLISLRREMHFDLVFRMNFTGAVCHALTGITLAKLGFGFLALAWANVANCFGTLIVAFMLRPRTHLFRPSLKESRAILHYGFFVTSASLLQDVTTTASDLIIGRVINLPAVGIFSKATGLNNMVNQNLVSATLPVALSAFAQQHRAGDSVKEAYLGAVRRLTALAWPAFLFIMLMAYAIIRALFGPQWDAAVPLAQILSIGGLFAVMKYLQLALYQAIGQPKPLLRVQSIITPTQIILFLVMAPFGLVYVACAAAFTALLEWLLSQFIINRLIGLTFAEFLGANWKSAVVSLASTLAPAYVLVVLPPSPEHVWTPLLLGALGTIVIWAAAIMLVRHSLSDDLTRTLRQFPGFRAAAKLPAGDA